MFRQTSGTSQPWWVATCPVGSVIRRGMFRTHNVRQHLRGLWRSLQSQANGCVFSKILYPFNWREEIGIFFLFPLQNLENMQPCLGNCLEHCTSVRSVTCMLQAMHDLMSLQISYVCRSNDTKDLMLLQISCYCKFHFSADLMSPFITSLLMLWKSYLLIMHSPPGKKWSIILNWIFLTCPESGFSSNILSHRAKDVLKVS